MTRGGNRVSRTHTLSYLLLAMILLGALSYWAPWVDHDTAALKLSGQDLGEFVKFIPEIRRGQMHFPRQLFYLPPFVGAIALVLLSTNHQVPFARWVRVGMLVAALPILAGVLPPAWGHPQELFTPEFRLQGLALLIGVLAIAAHGLFRSLPLLALALASGVLAFVALVPAQWAFWAIRPRIWAVYDTPTMRLGWGVWLHIAAWGGMLACAAALLREARNARQERHGEAYLTRP